MILGIGTDLVELARLERAYRRHGDRFVDRVCLPSEIKERSGQAQVQHLGGLFAAKEAVLKALGTGWAKGLSFRQVEVAAAEGGRPEVRLHADAAAHAESMGITRIHLSITHERRYAAAVAIAEGSSDDG